MSNYAISIGYSQFSTAFNRSRRKYSEVFHPMRHRFIIQIPLGAVAIKDIEFDLTSRHELVPILMALKHLYVHSKDTLDLILGLIDADMRCAENPNRGCIGMSHWENLVLASLRLGCNLDYDQLADLATNHRKIRQLLGLSNWDDKLYRRSTIHENLNQLAPDTLQAISDLIVQHGHQISRQPLKRVRADSFVVKKNIHHPTDSSLIVDGIRTVVNISRKIARKFDIAGWRKHGYLKHRAKQTLRKLTVIARSRKADKDLRMKAAYRDLLEQAEQVIAKAGATITDIHLLAANYAFEIPDKWQNYLSELQYYIGGTEYVCELSRRRVIEGETIINQEKVFSLFEPDTELINRGKRPLPIEFGHRVLIVEDNAGFIIHSQQMDIGFTDEKVIVEVMKDLQARYDNQILAASFDKGFWTPTNLKQLSEIIPLVVLPKKGKRSAADQQRETSREFGTIRKWHAGVESAIHALGHNGMALCRDKGPANYERYIAMAALGRNLLTLGKILIDKERRKRKKIALQSLTA